ncbi:MAG: DUF4446 family protein [Peptococcaceae bacterium]
MEILAELNQYAIIFTAVMAVLALIFLIRLVQLQGEIKALKKKYTALTLGVNGENLSQIVEDLVASNAQTQQISQQLEQDVKDLRKRQQANLNHVAIMHYNAFDFTYGELSFSMAVLDDLGNGYIFTNIHNRDDARCYCKRILNGESKHPLSDEEKEVLEYAINNEVNYSRTARNTAVSK